MKHYAVALLAVTALGLVLAARALAPATQQPAIQNSTSDFLGNAQEHARQLVDQGQQIFRFDTFGDEVYWGGQLGLHQFVASISPRQVLDLGLKVDAKALPPALVDAIKNGQVNLDDPAVTVQLVKANAVLGVVGFSNGDSSLSAVGLTCALCHSTVDNAVTFGIGKRIDGLANRDLDIGKIVASVPNLQPVIDRLRLANPALTQDDVRQVLLAWGPGKFDAELFLDGKAFNPQQVTNGVVTGTQVPGAALIPNARGLAGHNLHTWTGGWGTVTYWNAFVAVNELHGSGTFFDARFDNAEQFPIAAKAGLGHGSTDPDQDQVTSKLPALHFYQLALPAV